MFLALGGIGEIGMNCYLYGLGPAEARQWLMVDLGITFPEGENDPGIDVILPDLRFIEEERAALAGIVLTHAHEDHFGAVIELWSRLQVPIYATPFTAALLTAKLAEFGGRERPESRSVALDSRFQVGAFDIELVSLAHSIPESNALVIRTPLGVVLHTGDWKLDATPLIGAACRRGAPRPARRRRRAWPSVCDSTNAMREGRSPSEREVARRSAGLIRAAERRVAVTIFASNVARIRAVADAASGAGRQLVVAGRAMHRIIEAAMDTGYLPSDFKYHDQEHSQYLERDETVLLVHGQPRRAAGGDGPHRRGPASPHKPRQRRPGDLLLAHHSRQRARRRADPQPADRSRLRARDRRRCPGARHRPPAPRGVEGDVCLGEARWPCPCTARRGILPSMPSWRVPRASTRW